MKKTIKYTKLAAVAAALLAAVFYALNIPFSKLLLEKVGPTFLASFLYFGAGIGVGILYLFHFPKEKKTERLVKSDLPYTIGMVVLDIAAPIFLMMGIRIGSASNASLLSNFEIVATALIALVIFHEKISAKLGIAIGVITLSCLVLSFEGTDTLSFSLGSALVLLATLCWGFENNCTRKISGKSTYEIVFIKGIGSGIGSFAVALLIGESLPAVKYIFWAMALGFVAYGLSIFFYIRAQRELGAAKTSAYYAAAPFVGSFLSALVNHEKLTLVYFIGLGFMLIGSVLVVQDTLVKHHAHLHTHLIVHTHDGFTHTHTLTHEHDHAHFVDEDRHGHHHDNYENSEEHKKDHERMKKEALETDH